LPPRDEATSEFINLGRVGQTLRTTALSGDGSTVLVHEIGGRGYRWTREEGLQELPTTPGRQKNDPYAVSFDGRVVVGELADPFPKAAYRWTAETGIELLGNPPGFANSHARAVSADGRVIVGFSTTEGGPDGKTRSEAWLWTDRDGFYLLGEEATNIPYAVSADGRNVVGSPGFRWTHSLGALQMDGIEPGLGVLPRGLSTDGRMIVGHSQLPPGQVGGGFRWSAEGGFELLGVLPSHPTHTRSEATAVSADGSVVVGNSNVAGHPYLDDRAIVWDEVHGMRELEQVLADEYGLAQTHPWGLGFATAISADRRVVAGWSREGRARGNTPSEAWVVYLNKPIGPPHSGESR
jgi:probable HAF family extracellular repeat protein